MKKSLVMSLLVTVAALGLNACGDQKITQQVTIDKSLLEALQGKTTTKSTDGATTTTTPSAKPSPTSSSGSSSGSSSDDSDASAAELPIFVAIRSNALALNTQDIQGFTNTLHPGSQFMAYMPNLFYLLIQAGTHYAINDMKVQRNDGTDATVLVNRDTTDISGTINQQITYTMRKSGTVWRVFFMANNGGGY